MEFYSRLGPVRENTEWKCVAGCCNIKVFLISFFPFYLHLPAGREHDIQPGSQLM